MQLGLASVRRWTHQRLSQGFDQWTLVTVSHGRKLALARQAAGRWANQRLSHGWTRWRALMEAAGATARIAQAAAAEAARAAATRAAAIEAEAEAQRLQLEADNAALLNALISGCADEISQRHRLLGTWTDGQHLSLTPEPTRHGGAGADPSIAGLFQTLDTDGDGKISMSEWAQAFERAQLQPVAAMPSQVAAAQSNAAELRDAYLSAARHTGATAHTAHTASGCHSASSHLESISLRSAALPTFPSRNLPEAVEALRATPMAGSMGFGACNRTPASADVYRSPLEVTSAARIDDEIAQLRSWVERESSHGPSSRLSSRSTNSARGSMRSIVETPRS
jgi:hypothetical protein